MAIAETPELTTDETLSADIECTGSLSRGQMLVDRRPSAPEARIVDVAKSVDYPEFHQRFSDAIASQ